MHVINIISRDRGPIKVLHTANINYLGAVADEVKGHIRAISISVYMHALLTTPMSVADRCRSFTLAGYNFAQNVLFNKEPPACNVHNITQMFTSMLKLPREIN